MASALITSLRKHFWTKCTVFCYISLHSTATRTVLNTKTQFNVRFCSENDTGSEKKTFGKDRTLFVFPCLRGKLLRSPPTMQYEWPIDSYNISTFGQNRWIAIYLLLVANIWSWNLQYSLVWTRNKTLKTTNQSGRRRNFSTLEKKCFVRPKITTQITFQPPHAVSILLVLLLQKALFAMYTLSS